MVGSRHLLDRAPIEIEFDPPRHRRGIPVEVVDRSGLLARITARQLESRQRAGFHQLVLCTAGHGTHDVDFESVELSVGTLLHVHPGQVQRFVPEPFFEAHVVVWPSQSHHADPESPAWYPGCEAPTRWQLEGELLAETLGWVEELRHEQDRFDGSPRRTELMRALLSALLLRVAIELPDAPRSVSRLSPPYLAFRELIEEQLYQRPKVVDLAREIGYSTRTLDRACQQVSGQTAKQVLDERIALEVRRLLTHTSQPVSRIAADLGFHDPSNFSKFVKRHLGDLPGRMRDDPSPEHGVASRP